MSKTLKRKGKNKLWLIIPALFAMLILLTYPTNYYLETPGDLFQVSSLVTKPKKAVNRNLYLVTVSEQRASVLDYLMSYTRPFDTRISEHDLTGGTTTRQYEQLQQWYMETSQNNAVYYAAKKAGVPAKRLFMGVYVMGIQKSSSFYKSLQVGDTIEQVDQQQLNSTKQMMHYLQSRKIGQKLTLKIVRNGKHLTKTGQVVKVAGTNKPGIGISLVEKTAVKSKPTIKIDASGIGGPSAGLMFTLQIYGMLSHQKLAPGVKIAGTGTIDQDGKVGIIGGIDKKVVSADRAGAKVFFAPTDQPAGYKKSETNYVVAKKTAKKIGSKMKIVPVATFEDALTYLQNNF